MIKKNHKSVFIKNRKALFDYEPIFEIEAGLSLLGWEVKAIRENGISLGGSFCKFKGKHFYLFGSIITPTKFASMHMNDLNPNRDRILLLHKHEIEKLASKMQEKGLSVIPLELYESKGKLKLKIALCKGKTLFDKRDSIKEQDLKREARMQLKDIKKDNY